VTAWASIGAPNRHDPVEGIGSPGEEADRAARSRDDRGILGPSLVGREREAGLIGRRLDDVRSRGAVIVVEGPAGIGKSALLGEARRIGRERGMLVMSTAGVQSEADLPFAGLHQLLRPFLAMVGDLPAPQREAVRAAFGLGEAAMPEPFLIALGALGLLSDAAARRPIVLSVEDAHWLDRPSADALAFIARRVESDAVVLLVAIREGYESPLGEAGLPALRLDGLAGEAAGRLLDERFPDLSGPARRRVLQEAEGNPLALLELPEGLRAGPSDRDAAMPSLVPLTVRLERAFAARAQELPAATQTLLLVAAADEENSLATTLAAAEIIDGAPRAVDDLVPATRARLIEVDAQQVRFRHPLVRSAIYQTASVAQRHAAHAALGQLFADDPDRSAWHRGAAAVGPDSAVAADLEEAGRRALRRGAVTTAAGAFERAATLTRDTADRGRLLLSAAAAAGELGRGQTVLRLLRQADSLELGVQDRARWMLIEDGFREGPAGDPARVRELVETASRVATIGDADLALDLLTAAASRCYWSDLREEGRDVVRAADSLGMAVGCNRLLFVQAFAAPIERGADVLGALDQAAPPEDAAALYLRGMAVCLTGAFDRALPLLSASAQLLREQGRLRVLAQVVSIRAWAALEVADFAVAIPAAEEASRLSCEAQHPLWETGALVAQATIAALRGDRRRVETLTAEADRIALPLAAAGLSSLVQYARGLLELGQGRYAEAYEQLLRISTRGDPACHDLTACHTIGDLAEAAAHSGRVDLALALVRDFEPRADQTPDPWCHAQMLLAHVQLTAANDGHGDGGEAQAVFDEALSRDLFAFPMVRARVELAYGEWLRRHRQRRESRAPLRAARDTFDALGMVPWAQRARQELRASGERSRRRERDSLDDLTPQELQIVQMAAQGLSNREIAQQLYLSQRTVESHLYRVFPKLGVTSRAQLVNALGSRAGAPV
jgi:DNA-binding CsgD family transcriptional regulator